MRKLVTLEKRIKSKKPPKAAKKTRKRKSAEPTYADVVKADTTKGGRPTLLTEERTRTLERALRSGMSQTQAAALIDVHRGTLSRWKSEGEDFHARVDRAVAEGKLAKVERLNELSAQTKNPAVALKATMFWLKHRAPEDFGSGAGGAGGTVVVQQKQQNVIVAATDMLKDALDIMDENGRQARTVGTVDGKLVVKNGLGEIVTDVDADVRDAG